MHANTAQLPCALMIGGDTCAKECCLLSSWPWSGRAGQVSDGGCLNGKLDPYTGTLTFEAGKARAGHLPLAWLESGGQADATACHASLSPWPAVTQHLDDACWACGQGLADQVSAAAWTGRLLT